LRTRREPSCEGSEICTAAAEGRAIMILTSQYRYKYLNFFTVVNWKKTRGRSREFQPFRHLWVIVRSARGTYRAAITLSDLDRGADIRGRTRPGQKGMLETVAFLSIQAERPPGHGAGERFDVQHDLAVLKDPDGARRLADRDRDGLGRLADGGGGG